jgi:hypothetical protein
MGRLLDRSRRENRCFSSAAQVRSRHCLVATPELFSHHSGGELFACSSPRRVSHCDAKRSRLGERVHRCGHVLDRLRGPPRRDFESSLGRDLHSWPSEIEADDRPTGCHRFRTHPRAGVVKARVNKHIALEECSESVGAGQRSKKADPVLDLQGAGQRFQRSLLGTSADDPVFG